MGSHANIKLFEMVKVAAKDDFYIDYFNSWFCNRPEVVKALAALPLEDRKRVADKVTDDILKGMPLSDRNAVEMGLASAFNNFT